MNDNLKKLILIKKGKPIIFAFIVLLISGSIVLAKYKSGQENKHVLVTPTPSINLSPTLTPEPTVTPTPRPTITPQPAVKGTQTEHIVEETVITAILNPPTDTPIPPTNTPTPTVPIQIPTNTPVPPQPTSTPIPPTPTPEVLDSATQRVLIDIATKMCSIQLNINWRRDMIDQVQEREHACWDTDCTGMTPYGCDSIKQQCSDSYRNMINAYQIEITNLQVEYSKYDRQKNTILVGCTLCIEYWEAINKIFRSDPKRFRCTPL